MTKPPVAAAPGAALSEGRMNAWPTRVLIGNALRTVAVPGLVSAITLRSLVMPGYLVQVDSAFGPRSAPVPWSLYGPVQLLSNLFHGWFGGEIAGRIYVFGALFVCGVAAMVLLRGMSWWIQVSMGILAMLNPFVYDRLVEGQWGVVVAAAGLFLFVAAWPELRTYPGLRSALAVIAAGLTTIMFSADFAGILVVLALGMAVFASEWSNPRFRIWALASYAGIFLGSIYGIIPFFLGHGPGTYQAVSAFGPADFIAFRSTPAPNLGSFGIVPALVGLYGDWSERLFRYPVADIMYPWWLVPSAFLALLAVVGAFFDRRRGWLLLVGAIGIFISASTSTTIGARAVNAITSHVPLLAAYREPQKWDSLWLVALVLLGATALATLAGWLATRRPRWRAAAPLLAAFVVVAAMAPAGWVEASSASDIVVPVKYPESWYRTAAYMSANVPPSDTVAVLPWHFYETLPFIDRQTNNPAGVFFPGLLLMSQSPELPGQKLDLLETAQQAPSGCSLATALRSHAARWALVFGDVEDGPRTLRILQRCGFATAFQADSVFVLKDSAGG